MLLDDILLLVTINKIPLQIVITWNPSSWSHLCSVIFLHRGAASISTQTEQTLSLEQFMHPQTCCTAALIHSHYHAHHIQSPFIRPIPCMHILPWAGHGTSPCPNKSITFPFLLSIGPITGLHCSPITTCTLVL